MCESYIACKDDIEGNGEIDTVHFVEEQKVELMILMLSSQNLTEMRFSKSALQKILHFFISWKSFLLLLKLELIEKQIKSQMQFIL